MSISIDQMTHSAFDQIFLGNSILFVGAGISFLSKDQNGCSLPNGEQLRNELNSLAGFTDGKHPLDRISGHYIRKKGAVSLCDYLTKRLKVSSYDQKMKEIYNANWRRIYTTNYDDSIELCRRNGRQPVSLTLKDKPEKVPDGTCVHLNGFIDNISPHNIDQDFLLIDYSYSTNSFSTSPWSAFFRNDLRMARSIIFIGYSLYDLDISRILLEDDAIRSKAVFFISPTADEVEVSTIRQYGLVENGGVEAFYEIFRECESNQDPSNAQTLFYSLYEFGANPTVDKSTPSIKIHKQLVYGKIFESELLRSDKLFDNEGYVFNRHQVDAAIEDHRSGKRRDFIISGGLASGKTFASLLFAKYFHQSGYRVFIVQDVHQLSRDLDIIGKISGRVCVIFDGYRNYLHDIRHYVAQRPSSHNLILTERSIYNELMGTVIDEILDVNLIGEIHLDRLSGVEVEKIDSLINFAGLWEDLSGLSKEARCRHIKEKLESSLYRTLLEIIKSEKVQREIRSILESLKNDGRSLKFFTTAFIMNILGHEFWVSDWQAFYGIRSVRKIFQEHGEQISHFMIVEQSTLRARAGLISAYIIQNYTDDLTIGDCLVDMYKYHTEFYTYDDVSRQISIDLTKYSSVEPLFSDRNKLASLVDYYGRIRSIGDTRNNADYWLQYGIATTIHEDLEQAEIAFKNAYSREKSKRNPNLTRIDNYYSRFEMQKAIKAENSSEAFKIFSSASNRLSKQIFMDNNRHYPFKTGRAFSQIAAKHYDKWNPDQKEKFVSMCVEIRKKAVDWRNKTKITQPDVEILISETEKIIAAISP